MKKLIAITIILSFFIACQEETISITNDAVDHFFLKNNGAEMPVFVKGNTSSGVFIINLHGGPGGGAISTDEFDIYSNIELNFAIVYWDQRCAGNSQGNRVKLSIEKYVDDLHKLVGVVRLRYGDNISVFLLGGSWGGTLALSYLTTNNYQNEIKGCILSGALFNFPATPNAQFLMVKSFAQKQIALNSQVNEWTDLIKKLEKNSAANASEFLLHNGLAYQAKFLMTNVDSVKPLQVSDNAYMNYILFSNNHPVSGFFNEHQTDISMWDELILYNLTDRLKCIEIPIALYWGKYDFVSTSAMADSLYSILNSAQKELVYYNNSGHGVPGETDKNEYNNNLISFINTYQ